MKYTFITLLFLLCLSCSDDSDPSSGMFSWILGDGGTIEREQEFFSSENTTLYIAIRTESLCPDNGVELIITADGVEYENQVLFVFPFTDTLSIPANSVIRLYTKIVMLPNTMIECITLGSVECTFEY